MHSQTQLVSSCNCYGRRLCPVHGPSPQRRTAPNGAAGAAAGRRCLCSWLNPEPEPRNSGPTQPGRIPISTLRSAPHSVPWPEQNYAIHARLARVKWGGARLLVLKLCGVGGQYVRAVPTKFGDQQPRPRAPFTAVSAEKRPTRRRAQKPPHTFVVWLSIGCIDGACKGCDSVSRRT